MKTEAGVRVKSYFAASVDAAMMEARAELGDDALLLNTRKLGPGQGYEVVFGVPAREEGPKKIELSIDELIERKFGLRAEAAAPAGEMAAEKAEPKFEIELEQVTLKKAAPVGMIAAQRVGANARVAAPAKKIVEGTTQLTPKPAAQSTRPVIDSTLSYLWAGSRGAAIKPVATKSAGAGTGVDTARKSACASPVDTSVDTARKSACATPVDMSVDTARKGPEGAPLAIGKEVGSAQDGQAPMAVAAGVLLDGMRLLEGGDGAQSRAVIGSGEVSSELARLHAQIDEIRDLIARARVTKAETRRAIPELDEIESRLIAADVDAGAAREMIDKVERAIGAEASLPVSQAAGRGEAQGIGSTRRDIARLNGTRMDFPRIEATRIDATRFNGTGIDFGRIEKALLAEMERRVPIHPRLGISGQHGSIVALVGPTGAGKTTSIMKLAAGDFASGRRVRILTLDATRTGDGYVQKFAAARGIAYATVRSVHALAAMVEQSSEDEVVFIDTPGYANDDEAMALAAGAIGKIRGADVHLAAPGYMKSSDLARSIEKYEIFRPSKMLATKMDESDSLGAVFSQASRAGLALSFIADGLQIPENIRAARADDWLDLARERKLTRAQCA